MKAYKCTLFTPYPPKEENNAFVSTTWCRDRLFNSSDQRDIPKFYDSFSDKEAIIEWMKERPKGRSEIIEVDGDKDIIVVIPTQDFNGKYAKECRNSIFKGLHLIFVESGFPSDPYFNYSHNCNLGIKKAMEYDPKWVVISNDDMYKVDDVQTLKTKLHRLNSKDVGYVFVSRAAYHSTIAFVSKRTLLRSLLLFIRGSLERKELRLEKKFGINLVVGSSNFPYSIIYSHKSKLRYMGAFSILSHRLIRTLNGTVFDETFISGAEDLDLSLRLRNSSEFVSAEIDYKIGSFVGKGGFGNYTIGRRLRTLTSISLLNEKLERRIYVV